MDNITINETACTTSTELQSDEPMAEPGSVRGELISEPEILTDEQQEKLERRNYIMKVKVVAFDKLDKPLFINPRDMRPKDKEILIKTCEEIIEKYSPDQITEMFNHIICRDVLTANVDISALPIYSNKLI